MPSRHAARAIVLAALVVAGPAVAALPGAAEPRAEFAWSPPMPYAHEAVEFRSLSTSGAPIVLSTWRIQTRDGIVEAIGERATVRFGQPGAWIAEHNVTDALGRSSSLTRLVVVANMPPDAEFRALPDPARRGQAITFTSYSTDRDGDAIVRHEWDFGDGAVASGRTVTHAYAALGTYTVGLRVEDARGAQSATTRAVRVVNVPPIAAFHADPAQAALFEPVTFVDGSIDTDGTIVNWSWSFGDGRVAFGPHPTHPGYATAGDHLVRLTVRDDDGGTNTTLRAVHVGNRAPVARWVLPTGVPIERGASIQFTSSGHSFDPEGQPIRAWDWSFGDGLGASLADPVHVYAHSGLYPVRLAVSDGAAWSAPTPDSHRLIRVGADHDVGVHVRATRPDGSPVDLSGASYRIAARVDGIELPPEQIAPEAGGVRVTIPRDAWLHGSTLVLAVDAPFLGQPAVAMQLLSDGVSTLQITLTLPLALTLTVTPAEGDGRFEGHPVYADLQADVQGAGAAWFSDGVPAAGVVVDVEVRWVGLAPLGVTRTDPSLDAAAGWCRVGVRLTDADGAFAWRSAAAHGCHASTGGLGHAPGRWEVRAIADVPRAASPPSIGGATFFVDPTGGSLLAAAVGLA